MTETEKRVQFYAHQKKYVKKKMTGFPRILRAARNRLNERLLLTQKREGRDSWQKGFSARKICLPGVPRCTIAKSVARVSAKS